ncbi:hypothetical protein F5Y12DRAFT_718383 [Xylaria sp. FL1777]|nr:hypothetical protein F5Y12DRAFT_718383 [Xylaria sp. FL1777]
MSEKRRRQTEEHSDSEGQNASGRHRGGAIRSFGMPESEWRARERRRARFLSKNKKRPSDEAPEVVGGQTEVTAEAGESESLQLPVGVPESRPRKPWESLVIGSVGENLSRIEQKNREIEQQKFIVQFHEEHSPHQVEHNRRILNQLIQERAEMADNKENNMPQDQREKSERISRRLELLRWVLESSRCEDERINVRAAIHGYESGYIPYSHEFTLIYAGHVVDKCPNYQSFRIDRYERLDRYFARHGPGWLWQEPPLAGHGSDVLGMKGICLNREFDIDKYHVGTYQVTLKLEVLRDKVSKGKSQTAPNKIKFKNKMNREQDADASCRLGTLLDSGATFPIILESDLARLNMNVSEYPAQGVMDVNIVGGKSKLRFYEMHVSICSEDGTSLVGQGNEAVWPTEPRSLGGFCPVLAQRDPAGSVSFVQRLSGMMPFDACYMSSAPGMARIWLGEDRRDVLGTSRLPAHFRFDTDKTFIFQYPEEFESLRQAARTPDRVIFLHEFPDKPNLLFTDSDTKVHGKSEFAIGEYQTENNGPGEKPTQSAAARRVIYVEPRRGGIKTVPRGNRRLWKKDFAKHASV